MSEIVDSPIEQLLGAYLLTITNGYVEGKFDCFPGAFPDPDWGTYFRCNSLLMATGLTSFFKLHSRVGMRPCHPGEFIREEILHELHLPVARAAEILGVRRATLSDLGGGKAALSPEMALRIEEAFGVSMDTLWRMQAWYDSHAMRQRAGELGVKRYEARLRSRWPDRPSSARCRRRASPRPPTDCRSRARLRDRS